MPVRFKMLKNADGGTYLKRVNVKENSMENDLIYYHAGLGAATLDADAPDFDVDAAIASFNNNPPDSPYQRGYLRGLVKCGYTTSITDISNA